MLNIDPNNLSNEVLLQLVENVKKDLEDDFIDPIKLKSYLIFIDKLSKEIKDELNSHVLQRISGLPKEQREINGFSFSESSTGVKLDYSKDQECEELEKEMREVKKKLKARQDELKLQYKAFESESNKFTMLNKGTGEIRDVLPVLEPSKTTLKVTMK